MAVVFLCASAAWAQERATLLLKSGDRVAGELVDMGGVGFTVKVNGQDRQIPTGDVAVISFTSAGRTPTPAAGEHLLVLRTGETLHGQLLDIGGTHPLKITFKVNNTNRDLRSTEIARIMLSPLPRHGSK